MSLAPDFQSEIHSDEDSDVISHVVFMGDTLERIAEWYQCTIQDLTNLNSGVRPDSLHPGQKLRLPRNDRTCGNTNQK